MEAEGSEPVWSKGTECLGKLESNSCRLVITMLSVIHWQGAIMGNSRCTGAYWGSIQKCFSKFYLELSKSVLKIVVKIPGIMAKKLGTFASFMYVRVWDSLENTLYQLLDSFDTYATDSRQF